MQPSTHREYSFHLRRPSNGHKESGGGVAALTAAVDIDQKVMFNSKKKSTINGKYLVAISVIDARITLVDFRCTPGRTPGLIPTNVRPRDTPSLLEREGAFHVLQCCGNPQRARQHELGGWPDIAEIHSRTRFDRSILNLPYPENVMSPPSVTLSRAPLYSSRQCENHQGRGK